jgi:hypothetical protein
MQLSSWVIICRANSLSAIDRLSTTSSSSRESTSAVASISSASRTSMISRIYRSGRDLPHGEGRDPPVALIVAR